jgi:hypothetical protein
MKPMFPRTGPDGSAAGSGSPPLDETLPGRPAWREDRACCCPAQPVVRVIMPPTAERQHSVDLLLCGHHYRVSRPALEAARARIENLPGKADTAEAALLGSVHWDHAGAMWPGRLSRPSTAAAARSAPGSPALAEQPHPKLLGHWSFRAGT